MRVILKGFLTALFLIIFNGVYLFYKFRDSLNIETESSIREITITLYKFVPLNYKFFILLQCLLVIVIMIVITVRKFKSRKGLSKKDFINGMKSQTDLDILYEILKREKWVTLDNIEKVFNVNSEIALDWSKVLENGNLAIIDYPRFGKPVLRLLTKDVGKKFLSSKNTKNQCDIANKEVQNEVQKEPRNDIAPVKQNVVSKNIRKKKKSKKTKKRVVKVMKKNDKKAKGRGKGISKPKKKINKR